MSFSEKLKQLRKEKGLTQEELALAISKNRSTIAGYETERKEPDHETLRKLADYFDVSIDYLLGRTIVRNFQETTIATHRKDGYEENLSPEAQEELEKFKEYLRHKYRID